MKTYFVSLAFVLVTGNIFAQATFKPGVRAGLNITTIEEINATAKTGAYVGLVGSIKMNRFYTLQPELNFSMQGANEVYNIDAAYSTNTNIPLNYLGFAVMNKFNLKSFFLQVGPSLDFLMNESVYVDQGLDVAINAGLGYEFNDRFAIEARYKAGVADLIETGSVFLFIDEINYNSVFQIGLQYKFK